MNPKDIRISDYQYELPDERIAKFPVSPRDHSRLLVYRHGEIADDYFYNLPQYLPDGSLMVFNNTRVIQARLHFRKSTGALIEIFLLEPAVPSDYEQMFQTTSRCTWHTLVGNQKKWKTGDLQRELTVRGHRVILTALKSSHPRTSTPSTTVTFTWDVPTVSFAEILEAVGELPIPPYLNRETQESDKTTYQTVYSKIKGSVAAPTAGLHFTDDVLHALDERGIVRQELTLHVGAGTFRPVKSEVIAGHDMHTEYVSVRREVIRQLLDHQTQAIAVGTTSVRTLESLYYMGCHLLENPSADNPFHVSQWEPYDLQGHDESCGCEDGSSSDTDFVPPYLRTPLPTPQAALTALLDWLDAHQLEVLHGSTQIIIVPGYEYKIVKALVTNFHQPQSTLLLLVSAFLHGDWQHVYDHALSHDYRFLSYGDSSLLIP